MMMNYFWGGWEDNSARNPRDLSSLIRDEEEKELEEKVQDLDELADRLLTQFPAYGTNHNHASMMQLSQQDADDWRQQSAEEQASAGGGSERDGSGGGGGDDARTGTMGAAAASLMESRFGGSLLTTLPPKSPSSMLTPTHNNNNNGNSNNNHNHSSHEKNAMVQNNITFDWDFDEQFLWKAVGGEEKTNEPKRGGYASTGGGHNHKYTLPKNTPGNTYVALKDDASQKFQQEQQPKIRQQQWIYGKNSNYHHQESTDSTGASSSASTQEKSSALVLANNNGANNAVVSGKSNNNTPNNNNGNTSSSNNSNNGHDFYNSKQHWMPDQLCKHCYACDTPFTVFRRRHHCRLCGQVFCASCSAYFVPSQKKGSSTLRTCQMCHEQVTAKGGLEPGSSTDSGNANANSADGSNSNSNTTKNATGTATNGSGGANDSATATGGQKIEDGITRTADGRPVITDTKSLTIQNSPAALRKSKDNSSAADPPVHDRRDATSAVDSSNTTSPTPKSAAKNKEPAADREQSSELSSQSTHWRATSASGDNNTAVVVVAGAGPNINSSSSSKSDGQHEPKNVKEATKTIQEEAPAKVETSKSTSASSSSLSAAETAVADAAFNKDMTSKEATRHLGLTAANHLEEMGSSLLQKDAPLLWQEVAKQHKQQAAEIIQQQWLQKLMTLATRCCATVEPNVKKGMYNSGDTK